MVLSCSIVSICIQDTAVMKFKGVLTQRLLYWYRETDVDIW